MVARENEFDVIMLGAGPAGSAAAILCRQNHLRVALVEREVFPRDRPGETLHPGIESVLRQLGVDGVLHAAGFLRHRGHWVRWPSELRFEPFGADKNGDPWLGFQAWRATFDALLLERACRLGAIVRQPCQATGLLLDGRRVIGVQTSGGNLKARFVIDAAGGGHWLARKLALPLRRYSPRLIARFGYVRGECPARDEAPALLADAEGWTWTARVRPQLYQWTRLSWDVASTQGDYLPDEFYGLEPQGKTRAADVTWRIVTDCAGDGYFLAGDAAAQLDPAASHGVLKGLMSGMMVAHLINKVMRGEATEQQATQSYREWLAGWFKADVERLRELYALLPECEWVVATQL